MPGLGHLDFDGKLRVVLAPRFELAPDADDLRLARPHIALDVAVMQRVMRLRHEHVDVAPDQFLGGIAEHRGRRRIDRLDDPVLVDGDDRIDHSVDDRSGARFAVAQRLVRAPPVADVDECDDEALDFVFDRAVGLHPHQAPAALEAQHLALVRREFAKHRAGVVGEAVVIEGMGEIGDRAAFIPGNDVEEIGDRRREALDPQLRVEEQYSDVRRRHQVLDIAMGARHAFELGLQARR